MASYDVLTFQQSVFKEKMLAICDEALNEAVESVMKNEYFANGVKQSLPEHDNFDGYIEVFSSDLKAWLVEYGTGSYMRDDNPYLSEYKNSPYYFGLRRYKDDAIVFRGKRSYTQLDYKSGHGEVNRTGSNPAGKVVNYGTPAKPFLQELLAEAYATFETSLSAKLNSFDITSCFNKSEINM